ncbi:MAG: polyprenyl synthetase family protein [Cycloclasticus sp.]|nr:polyprenyl synthetase family protein [Cycloclasticus sp.]MBQ0790144.1 polyprenyl synthetase family protein [Cycloclasticus sp.]
MIPFEQFQQHTRQQIERVLAKILPSADIEPRRLHQAMRYSTLDGGKRIRALISYACGHLLDIKKSTIDSIACSIELIHAYSLIHDDLPSMDDDDLRRGKPSCHKAYDEATAILAGDALLTLAFNQLSKADCSAEQRIRCIQLLSQASGSRGMVGGQAIDLANEGQTVTIAEVESMHLHKTGALICACITLVAGLRFDASDSQYKNLKHYAECLGLAFQIHDDILDETSSTETLGKTQGKDQQSQKSTYPALIGLSASRQLADDLFTNALENLSGFDHQADYLRAIAAYTIKRKH